MKIRELEELKIYKIKGEYAKYKIKNNDLYFYSNTFKKWKKSMNSNKWFEEQEFEEVVRENVVKC